jgi:HK97 family phage major capsid protein
MTDINEAIENLESTAADLHKFIERSEEESKTLGESLTETKNSIETVQDRLDQIETTAQRSLLAATGGDAADYKDEDYVEYWNQMQTYLRKDNIRHDAEEIKALIVSNDELGGYLAPPEYVREIIKGIIEFSPIRALCRVRSTNMRSMKIPVRKGVFAAQWVSEIEDRAETEGLKWGLEEIFAHELNAHVKISRDNLEDSVFDLEGEIRMEVDEQFGVAEGTAFILGNGVGKPEGLLTNSDIGSVDSNTGDVLSADDFIDQYFDLKNSYSRNGTWVMNRQTIRDARKLKVTAGTDDQYIWQPGLAGLAPATILDRPYVEAVDMPDVADAATPVLFGDFRRGYTIVDRIGLSIQKLVELYAGTNQIGFIARRRTGGQVVLAEAINKLTIT